MEVYSHVAHVQIVKEQIWGYIDVSTIFPAQNPLKRLNIEVNIKVNPTAVCLHYHSISGSIYDTQSTWNVPQGRETQHSLKIGVNMNSFNLAVSFIHQKFCVTFKLDVQYMHIHASSW